MQLEAIPPIAYRPRDDWAQRGEVQRAILPVMREADCPMRCADITKAAMAAPGVDAALYALHRKRMSRALDKLRERGLIVSQRELGDARTMEGEAGFWQLRGSCGTRWRGRTPRRCS